VGADLPPIEKSNLRGVDIFQEGDEAAAGVTAAPPKRTGEVVPRAERQDGDRRGVLEPGVVKEREYPSDRTVAAADEDAEAADGAEGLKGVLSMALAQVHHLRVARSQRG
jgi:hypothetical protein